MTAILRVEGPPGSGKTLLIAALAETLRSRGRRVATAVRRGGVANAPTAPAGITATVIVLSNGGRVTLERAVPLPELGTLLASIDPGVDLLLAEAFGDDHYPAVVLSPTGRVGSSEPGVIATVSSAEIAASFQRSGPGEMHGLADRVEREVLGVVPDRAPGAGACAGQMLGARLVRAASRLRAHARSLRRSPGRGRRRGGS